jgi:ADP-ribose pyrophosphatase YjhB (NUDIX family)
MKLDKCCHFYIYKKTDLEQKKRKVCKKCGFVDYKNPKIVAGSLVVKDRKILLCRRAIKPSYGKWTFPSGYLDKGESPEFGAKREALEEVNVKIKLEKLIGIVTVKKKNLIQFIFVAKQVSKFFKPGIETLEAKYFNYKDIPWKDLAFSSVKWALKNYKKAKKQKIVLFKTF